MTEEQFAVGGLSNQEVIAGMGQKELYVYGVHTHAAREILDGAVLGGYITQEEAQVWATKVKAEKNAGGVWHVLQDFSEQHPGTAKEVLGKSFGNYISERTAGAGHYDQAAALSANNYLPERTARAGLYDSTATSSASRTMPFELSPDQREAFLTDLFKDGLTFDGEVNTPGTPLSTPPVKDVQLSPEDIARLTELLRQRHSGQSQEQSGRGIG